MGSVVLATVSGARARLFRVHGWYSVDIKKFVQIEEHQAESREFRRRFGGGRIPQTREHRERALAFVLVGTAAERSHPGLLHELLSSFAPRIPERCRHHSCFVHHKAAVEKSERLRGDVSSFA